MRDRERVYLGFMSSCAADTTLHSRIYNIFFSFFFSPLHYTFTLFPLLTFCTCVIVTSTTFTAGALLVGVAKITLHHWVVWFWRLITFGKQLWNQIYLKKEHHANKKALIIGLVWVINLSNKLLCYPCHGIAVDFEVGPIKTQYTYTYTKIHAKSQYYICWCIPGFYENRKLLSLGCINLVVVLTFIDTESNTQKRNSNLIL